MKRIALIIVLFILVFSVAVSTMLLTALAEDTSYLEVTGDNVKLYENTVVQDALFTLPRTYYVKVIRANITSTYHLVEYNGVEGLVKVAEVSGTPITNVSNPYYTSTRISAHAGQYLYNKPVFSEQTNIAAGDLTLLYLGKIEGEKRNYGTATWFAVQYTNKVYYIHSAMTENLDLLESGIPAHPNSNVGSSTEEGKPNATSDKTKGSSDVDVVRILLILGMFVPIVIILLVLFRPRRKRARNRIDREEEDDDY